MLILNKYFNYLERKEMNINVTNKALDEIKKVLVTNKALNEVKKILKEKNATSIKIRIFLAGIG